MKRIHVVLVPLLLVTIALLGQSSTSTRSRGPEEVLKQFCRMDGKGVRLTPEGWSKAAALFVRPEPPSPVNIIVIKDFVISPPKIEGTRAELYVEYIYLGQIDPSTAHFQRPAPPLPPDPSKVRTEYTLLLAGADRKLDSNGEIGRSKWRIEGEQPEQHITVETAIQYVTHIRDKATDAIIRSNADKTLAILRQYRGKQSM